MFLKAFSYFKNKCGERVPSFRWVLYHFTACVETLTSERLKIEDLWLLTMIQSKPDISNCANIKRLNDVEIRESIILRASMFFKLAFST